MNKTVQSASESKQVRVVFPKHLNPNGTFFGGEAMQWLDEVAFITATRFTRQRMLTVKIENVRFLKPVLPDSILEIVGEIFKAGNVKLLIRVTAFAEEMFSDHRERVLEADFIFAPCNDELLPIPLNHPSATSINQTNSGNS